MSFGAFDDVKEQIRQAVDIVELIGGYLDLRPQGRDFVAHCPWHDDARPSLRVSRDRQSWKCWVCNIGGDAFSFVMRREGIGFREALEMLAERAGIRLPDPGRPAPAPGSPQDKRALYQAAAWTEQQFHRCLLADPAAESARRYLAERGIDGASIQRFRLGYSPPAWQWLLDRAKATAFTPQILDAVGLVARSERTGGFYDRFRGRVIFPIRDAQGRPIAFGGRVLPGGGDAEAAKYINSPETRLFAKSEQLYGLDVVRDQVARTRQITVMEGYTDVVLALQYGLDNAVAVLGTALGTRHLKLLKRFADVVTLVLDGDEAGRRRTNEILKLFIAEQLDVRVLTLPDELDPADFFRERGLAEFQRLLAAAPDALQHSVSILSAGLDPERDTHRANAALEEILKTMALAPAGASRGALRLREQQLLTRLARQFLAPEATVRMRLQELRSGGRAAPATDLPAASAATPRDLPVDDLELLEIITLAPELCERLAEQVPAASLGPGPAREIYTAYARRWEAKGSVTTSQVLTDLEDPELKSLLVQIEDKAAAKAERTASSPADRLAALLARRQRLATDRERRRHLSALESAPDDEEQLYRLQELLELTRQTRSD